MTENHIIPQANLELLQDKSLFYPCSGNDLLTPIKIFAPYITDFWFVDCAYFSMGAPADKSLPVLQNNPNFQFIHKSIDGPAGWPRENKNITPCILTETYKHIASGREIRIHRRRGYGFSALKNETRLTNLGVFFYRGDSQGEGGSGNMWLSPEHLEEALKKIADNGLLVLDGSDGGGWKSNKKANSIYRKIRTYTWKRENDIDSPEILINTLGDASDNKGRTYKCIGYAGMKYGPTMIWHVKQKAE